MQLEPTLAIWLNRPWKRLMLAKVEPETWEAQKHKEKNNHSFRLPCGSMHIHIPVAMTSAILPHSSDSKQLASASDSAGLGITQVGP
jgi:hypothetical protein